MKLYCSVEFIKIYLNFYLSFYLTLLTAAFKIMFLINFDSNFRWTCVPLVQPPSGTNQQEPCVLSCQDHTILKHSGWRLTDVYYNNLYLVVLASCQKNNIETFHFHPRCFGCSRTNKHIYEVREKKTYQPFSEAQCSNCVA